MYLIKISSGINPAIDANFPSAIDAPSELIVRKRVFPSGRPEETRQADEGPDVTWEREVEHFERLCAAGTTDLATDWWIAQTLLRVERQLEDIDA